MQQFQPPPGQWVWMPAPQPPSKPTPDTRLIRSVGEWFLFIGALVALVIVSALLYVQYVRP